jgi:hypothetical protein
VVFLLCCLFAATAVAIVVFPLFRRVATPVAASGSYSPVQLRKEQAFAALLDLDFDYRAGKLSPDDYVDLRERDLRSAARALSELELERERHATEVPDTRVEACRGCGTHQVGGGRYCVGCGLRFGELPYCGACSTELPAIARFCYLCGEAVKS